MIFKISDDFPSSEQVLCFEIVVKQLILIDNFRPKVTDKRQLITSVIVHSRYVRTKKRQCDIRKLSH